MVLLVEISVELVVMEQDRVLIKDPKKTEKFRKILFFCLQMILTGERGDCD